MSLKAMVWVMEHAPVQNHGELAVLYALADRANDDGSAAWPSQEWLAERARCHSRTVRRHLHELELRGIIRRGDQRLVDHIQGNRRPVVWDLNLSVRPDISVRADNMADWTNQTLRPDNSSTQAGQSVQLGRTLVSDKPSLTIHEPSNNQIHDQTSGLTEYFDEFWAAYPRKVGKQKARTKFTTATKRADPHTIIAGAKRLATDPNLPEKQFIPHPTTWLERDGWDDEPLPPRERKPQRQDNSLEAWLGMTDQPFVDAEVVDIKELEA